MKRETILWLRFTWRIKTAPGKTNLRATTTLINNDIAWAPRSSYTWSRWVLKFSPYEPVNPPFCNRKAPDHHTWTFFFNFFKKWRSILFANRNLNFRRTMEVIFKMEIYAGKALVISHWLREEIYLKEVALSKTQGLGRNRACETHSPMRSTGAQMRAIWEGRERQEGVSRTMEADSIHRFITFPFTLKCLENIWHMVAVKYLLLSLYYYLWIEARERPPKTI